MLREGVPAIDVFISYSHADKKHRVALLKQLSAPKRQGLVTTWSDRDIAAGAEWETELLRKLDSAPVILLLVSPDFVDSDYCWDVEMGRALARHHRGEARVIPIILRPCTWQDLPFGKLQALPQDGKPVTEWRNRDKAWLDVAQGIGKAVQELQASAFGHRPQRDPKATPRTSQPSALPQDPLALWCRQVVAEHRRLGDHFDRPAELRLIEQAWVQVQVRAAMDASVRGLDSAKHALLGQPTTLDAVLALPRGEPAWNQGRWLLEGPPGAGKTTLLRHLAARLASAAPPACVPVFVSLARLVDAGQELLHHVTDGLPGAERVQGALAAAGREGQLLLLLDGYDEVRRERRVGVHRLLNALTEDPAWSSCRMVVSSRPIGRGDALNELPRLDLLPLDLPRQQEFLENWFRHAGRDDAQTEASAALVHLMGVRGLRDLAGIPLYLTLLAELWTQGVRPLDLAALYDEVFQLLLAGSHRQPPRPLAAPVDVPRPHQPQNQAR